MPNPQKLINHGRMPSRCGQPATFESSLQLYRWKRVQGGHKVQPYSVPWLGQVLRGTFNICGTTLIAGPSMSQGSTMWALSAAHCFKSRAMVPNLPKNKTLAQGLIIRTIQRLK
uniref:Peptidase S1 domain-containing protein n=1 Tax=Romanomermis culicivorax TaxID=13658 RepID=A0A915J1R7_ROMCU